MIYAEPAHPWLSWWLAADVEARTLVIAR